MQNHTVSSPKPFTIGILQCDEVRASMRAEFDDYPDMFIALLSAQDPNLDFKTYRTMDSELPPAVDACDAYLITGSRAGVYEDHAWIAPAEEFVRSLVATQKPLVGICFGHQLIAQALGGRVEKVDKGWGQGLHSWRINAQPQWMGDEQPTSFSMLVSHQDQVLDLPAGATLLASSAFCPIAAFQYQDCALGLQGHPEFSKAYSRGIMDVRRAQLGEQTYREGVASLDADPDPDPDTEMVARWIVQFLRGS